MFDFYKKIGNVVQGKTVDVIIKINGTEVRNWSRFTVDLNGFGDIDTFKLDLPWTVGNEPSDPLLYSGATQSAELVNGTAEISIEAGYEDNLKLLISGSMDSAKWRFGSSGEKGTISGRSHAGRAYDEKETVKYQNMTATEVHAMLAAKHGLKPVAPIATTTMIGEYINDDHASLTSEESHWDLALYLAENEGFVTRVRGNEWYFGPLESLPNMKKDAIHYTYGVDISEDLNIERAPNASRNLSVEVISYQPAKTKRGKGSRIVEKSSSIGKGANKYTIRKYVPNITRDQAQRIAKNILQQMSRQQMSGSFKCDYNPELDIDRKIVLNGVGVGLSQYYFVQGLKLSCSRENGFKCDVAFSNLQLSESGGYR